MPVHSQVQTDPPESAAARPTAAPPEWVFDFGRAAIVEANDAAVAFWGADSRDALLARSFADQSPAVRLRLSELAKRLAAGEVVSDLWTFYPGGRPKTAHCLCRPQRLADGRLAMRVTAAAPSDVDLSLECLRWLEAFRHSPTPVALYTPSGRCIVQNPAAWRAFGPGAGLLDHIADPEQAAQVRRALDDGQPLALTARVLTDEGERWHDLHMRPVRDPATGEESALVQEIDVTAQRTASARLAANEALLSGVLESATDGVFAFRAVRGGDGAIVDFECLVGNPAAERLVGNPQGGLTGRRLNGLLAGRNRARLLAACRRLVETGVPVHTEVPHRLNGVSRWFRVSAVRFGDGFTATLCDITARRRMEAALRAARDQAEAASHAKSEFLASASHELRTPMNGILGALDLLQEGGVGADTRTVLSAARRSAATLMGLIDGILEFAALDAPRAGDDEAFFSPQALVEQTAGAMADPAAASGVRLDSAVDPAVPARVRGDLRRIGRVFSVLAGHAVAHAEGGRITLSASASTTRPGRTSLVFAVTASGARPRDGWGGTDLRLTLAQRLVSLIGGTLGRTESGTGAAGVVHSWFAVEVAEAAERPAVAAPAGMEPPAAREQRLLAWARRRGGRILVVDDSATNRLVVAAVLGKAGFTVSLAGGGADAVRTIADSREPPELVLMDVSMPDMDGLSATAAIRALSGERSRLPVVALTAHASDEDRHRCLAAGMNDHVAKPVRKLDLLDTLSLWLN
ncbi:response regulator [Azospirillum sp. A39]|uniref:response regulator n=1 Tax=Azospirillum sp. A39 TaxID=3462279 RepID=UPI004045B105